MLCGNDGGIQRTTNDTASTVVWTQLNTGYRTLQYYHVTLDPRSANDKVLGGSQDNGSTRNIGGTGSSYELVYGGDGVSVGLSDLISGTTYEYLGSQNGFIHRRTSTTPLEFTTDITPEFANPAASPGLFVTLFRLDPDNTERLYYANDDTLYRTASASTVTSATWTKMSGVAGAVGTTHDITALATTRGTYSAATASLFMGTSNGKIFRLDDPTGVAAASAPVDITGGTFPAGAYISSIAVNPRNDDTILVTFSSYGAAVVNAWWTGNANSATPTWTSVEGTLTLPSYRSSAIAVTATGVEYFIGTSVGLYTATGLPASAAWTQEGPTDMGNAVVTSLALRPVDNKLLVGTHGYGMWYTTLTLLSLPVTLSEFKGSLQNNTVLLQWSTSAEYNSKQFELERSFEGSNFRKIATIPAAGNSNRLLRYSFVDREPPAEKNFYRLRSVDLDLKNKLSNTVLIKVPNVKQDMIVLSNPVHDNITVRFLREPSGKIELRLIDLSGRLIMRQHFTIPNQQVRLDITPGRLRSGVYQLVASVDGSIYTSKVLFQ